MKGIVGFGEESEDKLVLTDGLHPLFVRSESPLALELPDVSSVA